jgi:phage tail tape-measure protein
LQRRGFGKPENRKTGKPENRKTGKPENRKTGKPENRKTGKPENRKTGKVEPALIVLSILFNRMTGFLVNSLFTIPISARPYRTVLARPSFKTTARNPSGEGVDGVEWPVD